MRPLLQKAIPGIEGFFVVRKDFGNPIKNNWQCHAGKAGYDEPYTFSVESCQPLKVKLPVNDFNGSSDIHEDRDNTHFFLEKPDQRHQRLRIFKVNANKSETTTLLDEILKAFIYLSNSKNSFLLPLK